MQRLNAGLLNADITTGAGSDRCFPQRQVHDMPVGQYADPYAARGSAFLQIGILRLVESKHDPKPDFGVHGMARRARLRASSLTSDELYRYKGLGRAEGHVKKASAAGTMPAGWA